MNKKIIGISVAMLFSSTYALAQSSVTLYGTVDAGVAFNKGSNAGGKTISLESGQQSYSRIGFKGKEDLGNGMSALFVLEQGVRINNGTSGYNPLGSGIHTGDEHPDFAAFGNDGIFSSQAYLGLSSKDLGTVTFGRQFSPLAEAYLTIDPFMSGFAANMNNFFGAVDGISAFQRMSNAVIYKTTDNANFYGFKGSLAYGFGGQAGSVSKESQVGASLGFANGPLTVAYAFHQARPESIQINKVRTHFLGATFDLGMVKLHGALDRSTADGERAQDYMVGATLPVGANSLFAGYTQKKVKNDSSYNARQVAIGYTHSLSKRTNFYTAYTLVKNKANSEIGTNLDDNLGGANVKTLQVGVRHMF
jgi:predicted porin